ncbi:Large-conductance mechanosensitive channel [uncultured Clostridium sp.]|nr:Large-conductance mechanosensitive channel [uncultured Clostridium sp.]
MSKITKEFKEFIMRGNVMDMAVGVIVGGAFSSIINSLVNDVLMPIISLATGKVDFTNLFIALDGQSYPTLDAAKASTSVFAYGSFIQTVIQFLIIAFSIFMVVKGINMLRRPKPEAAPTTKECPYCKSEIHIDAVKCPHCASELPKK